MKDVLFPLLLLMLVIVCVSSPRSETRKPVVAGLFYPDNAADLDRTVRGHLNNVKNIPEIDGQILALIVPHAGLVYSGQIAAYSYKLLENSGINKVILCGPSHRYGFDGLSVYGPDITWATPLGTVACDEDFCRRLMDYDNKIGAIGQAHAEEHCLEVQLPYLQTVLKDFTIVPVIMGRPSGTNVDILARALASLDTDEHTVMIASTDWQHYLPASRGWPMDSLGMDCLKHLDADRLARYLDQDKTQMCGGAPTVALLRAAMAKGANRVKILKYGDSGDVTGDKSSVVSYVAAVIYKSEKGNPGDKDEKSAVLPTKTRLSDEEKKSLLDIARQTIDAHLTNTPVPAFDLTETLKRPGAAFVTLEKQGHLRGCIGHTTAYLPLHETVAQCAISAATEDPRFNPVTTDEMDDIHIEISVLTPLQRVVDLDDIEVGRDGLMIFLGSNRGLLLPQVATEYGWNRTQFLENTCRKAGLRPDAYTDPKAEIFRFQAIIFGE